MSTRHTLLFAALAAATFTFLSSAAIAQDAPDSAGVPRDKLVGEYADTLFDGDEVAAAETVDALRTGGDFTTTTTVTRQATNPDGTPATNPDGTPRMETITVTSLVDNPNGPMGWGEVDHSLGLAEALVEKGNYGTLEEALLGEQVVTTVTNPDGTVTTTVTYGGGGLLAMRADGMGWGQVAKELGFKSLGEVKGNGHAGADAAAKPARAAKADTVREHGRPAAKPDRVARVDRPQRPEKLDRPSRPERPERPAKPERPGRN